MGHTALLFECLSKWLDLDYSYLACRKLNRHFIDLRAISVKELQPSASAFACLLFRSSGDENR